MSLTAISSLGNVEKKIFHKFDVHHVQTVGIKSFWAHEVEISLTAMSSPNRQDKKFS